MAITSSLDVSSLRRQARVKYWHGEICRCAWKLQDDNVLMCFRNFSISRLPSRPHSAAKRRRSVVTLFAAVWKRALLVALWRIYMLRIPECERRWEKRRDKREKIRGVARKGFLVVAPSRGWSRPGRFLRPPSFQLAPRDLRLCIHEHRVVPPERVLEIPRVRSSRIGSRPADNGAANEECLSTMSRPFVADPSPRGHARWHLKRNFMNEAGASLSEIF